MVVKSLFQDLTEETSWEVYRDRQTLKGRRAHCPGHRNLRRSCPQEGVQYIVIPIAKYSVQQRSIKLI